MNHDTARPLRKRVFREVKGVIADGAYASLLAIPVALGVAAYTFIYLSFLRHRLRSRIEGAREDDARRSA